MELRDYYRSYTEDELVRGAELYFSGELKDIKYVEKASNAQSITPYSTQITPCAAVSADYSVYSRGNRPVRKNCSIIICLDAGLPCSASCSCDEFTKSTYGCAHTAGLLTAYMVHKKGEEVFLGTKLESLLKNLADVDDPFAPGVLKKTDGRLLSLLSDEETVSLPTWNVQKTSSATRPPLSVECSLSTDAKGAVLLELKAGFTRKYVIKHLNELIDAYRNHRLFTIGREEVAMEAGICDDLACKIFDLMASIVTASKQGLYGGGNLFVQQQAGDHRYMRFKGREVDTLMELLDGETVTFREKGGCRIQLDRKGIKGILKKKSHGASFKILPLVTFAVTGSWMYLTDNEGLFRIAAGSTKEVNELSELFAYNEELYVRESDIGRLIERFVPLFSAYGSLTTKGLDPETYEKEKPSFEFFLDYDDGRLTCEAFAVYKQADVRCHLYDTVTGAVKRNAPEETAAAVVLSSIFDRLDAKNFILSSDMDEDKLFDFMRYNLPRLEATGKVLASTAIAGKKVRYLPSVSAHVRVENGSILMSLKGGDLSDNEMAGILGAYRKKKKYYRLKSGEFMSLETEDATGWNTLSDIYGNYAGREGGSISIPLYRALYIQESLEARNDVILETADSYKELLEKAEPEKAASAPVPDSLKDIIRPYQADGYRWLRLLKDCGFGGILADDMGLGKTLQVLSFILSEKEAGKTGNDLRSLVVCPASLVYNWKREIEKYSPSLSVSVIAGTASERADLINPNNAADIWVTSYDLLKRDITSYSGIRFANEFIDEAQYIKNQNTQASQSVRIIDSSFRVALTGTPIENHLSELWSIMDYLMPGFLYGYSTFQKEYEIPIVVNGDKKTQERLRRMVHPFILRRLKRQVLKELPDKLEETIAVSIDGAQKKLYDAHVKKLRDELSGVSQTDFKSSKLQYLAQLTQLRQLCCDPVLLYEDYHGESAKLEACLELVRQGTSGGHKILLFSQFTTMLDIIGKRLSDENIEYHRIDGSVSKEKRMQMVDSFANDDVPVFCISLKAGGTGLNLTAADIVIHYDPWWNQAAQDQATDRTHRIGQTHNVNVYELIAAGTVEEHIQKIKERKLQLADDILSGGEIGSATFSKEDMLSLLG